MQDYKGLVLSYSASTNVKVFMWLFFRALASHGLQQELQITATTEKQKIFSIFSSVDPVV